MKVKEDLNLYEIAFVEEALSRTYNVSKLIAFLRLCSHR